MTTKLYFHNASNALSGTFPTGEQSVSTPTWSATGATTLRTMTTTIGLSQASLAGTTSASTSAQIGFLGFFCSPALSGAQSIGIGSIDINDADSESNTNANFFIKYYNIYIWRPGTNTKVGTLIDSSVAGTGALKPTSASSEQVTQNSGVGPSSVSAADGDVIIVELWASFAQAMATAYTATIFYDGTTENTTENAVVSSQASFIQFAETLTFGGGTKTVNLTGQSATASVGTVTPTYDTSVSLTGRSATASVGTVTPSVATNATVNLTGQSATASVGTVTETFSGQKTLTGQSATASVGTVTRQIDNNPALTGLSATASVGTVTETYTSTATLTGQSVVATVGTVSVNAAGNITVSVTGLSMAASVGTVAVTASGGAHDYGVTAGSGISVVTGVVHQHAQVGTGTVEGIPYDIP